MTTTHSARGLVWIDLQSPTDEEIGILTKRYGLHPLIGEELKNFPSPSKIDFHKDYTLAILTLPIRVKKGPGYTVVNREIDFVIGKNFLITAHPDGIDQLEHFAKIFETNAILNKDSKIDHTGHLFYYMMMKLYAGVYEDLKNIRDSIIQAEEQIFSCNEREMVEVLSELSRELIDFRETARIHRDIWATMVEGMIEGKSKHIFAEEFLTYVKDIRAEFNRINEVIQNSRELVSDLRETNDSLLNTRQNDIMKTLTIINFIFIPATFIAALFTIPASYVPLVGDDRGWTILFIIMIGITVGIWRWIKRKNWL